jgi:phage tail sheath protein FI
MATVLLSPGVISIENDQSQVTQGPVTVGAAIIGPTVKGPVEIPTIVTSYSDYVNTFGTTFVSGSEQYSYFTSIAAYNYFNNGGESLLVARVVSGSYTSATSSPISASIQAASQPAFVLETITKGTIMNSTGSEDTNGALANGSSDNIRWEIVSPSTSSGAFNLLIRQGNDNTNSKTVLETWTNLSLDPKAPNFISKVIGDYTLNYNSTTVQIQVSGSFPNASKYVRVKSVNLATPDYFDNNGIAKAAYTASIPLAGSGSFTGATGNMEATTGNKYYDAITGTNTQGLVSGSYTNMVSLLSNQDDYKFNVLFTPGLVDSLHTGVCTSIITNTANRGDNIFILDPVPYNSTVTAVVSQAASRDSSYAASYWPWCQVQDPSTGKNVWVPASVLIAGVYAYNDKVAEPWFAPAGINRGGLGTVIRPEQKLPQSSRDTLYLGKVNPIAQFPGTGVVVYGNKTLQTKASALDRVNVRRLLIALKSYIGQVANTLVFEQNTAATRNQFLAQVNPYLESVQQRQGLYAFRVVMDASNNTADVIDRNQLVGAIYLQPTKTAEYIYLNFNITPTGASFV